MCPLEMLDAHQKFEWRRFREAAQEGAVDVTTIALATLRHIDGVCMLDVLEHLDLCSKCVVVDPSKSQSTTLSLFSALLTTQRDTQVWQSHPHMTRHVGLKLSCSSNTRMLPPGVFPRLQMALAQRLSTCTLPCSIWSSSVWCSNGAAEVMVQLSRDARSVYAHARCAPGRQANALELLAEVCDCLLLVLERSVGVLMAVSSCRNSHLTEYRAEPDVYSLQAIGEAREKRLLVIGGGKTGPSEALGDVLRLTTEGTYVHTQ